MPQNAHCSLQKTSEKGFPEQLKSNSSQFGMSLQIRISRKKTEALSGLFPSSHCYGWMYLITLHHENLNCVLQKKPHLNCIESHWLNTSIFKCLHSKDKYVPIQNNSKIISPNPCIHIQNQNIFLYSTIRGPAQIEIHKAKGSAA